MILPSKLADEEASEDYIYDDLLPLEKGCNVTRFSSAEGSDGEYSDFLSTLKLPEMILQLKTRVD